MTAAPVAPGGVPLTGVALALGGAVVFSVNDMAIKFLSGGYPLHQVTMVRGLIAVAVLIVIMAMRPEGLALMRTRRPGRQILRMIVAVTANATYFLGLAAMPLADAVALAFVAPVFITLLSIVMLGEKVGPHRLGAVVAGLIGTLILMRPGEGAIQPAAILILVSAFCYALSQLMARSMRDTESAFSLSFYLQIGFLVSSILMGLVAGDGKFAGSDDPSLAFLLRPWVWPVATDWVFFLATGFAVSIGGLMIAQAYRTLEAAVAAPFEYASIPMAILWGALVFGTFPDPTGLIGMVLIVAAGLYTLWRETRRSKRA